MERPTCGTCPYWQGTATPDDDHASCRRHAPRTMTPIPEEGLSRKEPVWPGTFFDEWCGEHPDFPAYLQATRKAPGCL